MFWIKLKAGALQLTLFIAIIIAVLLTSFILLVHTHKKFNIQSDLIIETLKNADKGTYIFNSRSFDGAAYFNPNGDFTVEYMDEDIDEIQTLIFKKVN